MTLGSGVAVLVDQALEDPLGGVALLLRGSLAEVQYLLDHPEEGVQLGPRPFTRTLLVPWELDQADHLGQSVWKLMF